MIVATSYENLLLLNCCRHKYDYMADFPIFLFLASFLSFCSTVYQRATQTAEHAKGGLLPSLPRVEVSGGRQFFAAAELFLAIFSKFCILKFKKGEKKK